MLVGLRTQKTGYLHHNLLHSARWKKSDSPNLEQKFMHSIIAEFNVENSSSICNWGLEEKCVVLCSTYLKVERISTEQEEWKKTVTQTLEYHR